MAASASDNLIRITANDLNVAYGYFSALRSIKLDTVGNTLALIGHNGAGKSTLMKSVLDLLPFTGELTVSKISSSKEHQLDLIAKRHMAFCPEGGSVFADISVESYVKLWCQIKHRDGKYYRKAGSRYIERLDLAPLLSKLGRELSKGQRRRVQTAVGFLVQPRLFLIDEPFDGLDIQKTNELADIIREESQNMSFIVSSHRMEVVERICDNVIVLQNGQLEVAGSVDEVCTHLCKKSVRITNMSADGDLVTTLLNEYPDCVVNQVGNHVAISGNELEIEKLEDFVRQHVLNGVQLEEVDPCLVDAMNYHLKHVG